MYFKQAFSVTALFFLTFFNYAQPHMPFNGVTDNRPGNYAFINATIITAPGKSIQNGTMLVQDGRIAAIGSNLVIPNNFYLIDLKGNFIYPAFIDPISDYGIEKPRTDRAGGRGTQQLTKDRSGAFGANDALKSDQDARLLFEIQPEKAAKMRKSGFGMAATRQADGIARGFGALVALTDGPTNEALVMPQVASYFSFDKGTSKMDYPSSLMGSIALLRQAWLDANWYNALGNNKNFIDLSLEGLLKSKSLPRIFETRTKYDALRADNIGKEFGLPFTLQGSGHEYQYIDEVKKTNSSWIIPLSLPFAPDLSDPFDTIGVSLSTLKHWELAPSNAAQLERNKISFAFSANGLQAKENLWENMQAFLKYGLTEQTALAALTTVPASILGVSNLVGTLEKGKLANFLVCSHQLFDSESELLQTWVLGRPYTFQNPNLTDLRGKYNLQIDKQSLSLIISGKRYNPEAQLALSDTNKIKVKMALNQNQVQLNWELPNGEEKANYQALLFVDGQNMQGQLQFPNGKQESLTLVFQEPFKSIKEKPQKNNPSSDTASVWYPMEAFGFKQKPKPQPTIIKNATIWTNEQMGILTQADIAIQNNKIVAIGKNLNKSIFGKLNENIREIDGTNMHITPGLIDEHSHIAISRGVNEGTNSITSEVRIGDVLNPDDINIYRQLAGGVTTSHLLHGSANTIGGQTQLIKLRWGVTPDALKFENAMPFIKFALGENVKQSNWGDSRTTRFPQTRMGVEQVLIDAFTQAKYYQNQLQNKSMANRIRPDLRLQALVEIMQNKRQITCHSYVQSEINMLMQVGDSMGFRVNTFTHILEGYKVADKMKKHGAGASTFSDWWAYKYEVIDAIPYNPILLQQMGIVTAINSDDAEMGRRLNQEAAKAMKYGGMSAEEALKMVTLNPAKLLHIDNYVGSLKVGKHADLVVWNGNPLSIYSKPLYTFVDGIDYYNHQTDAALQQKNSMERSRLIAKVKKAKASGAKTAPATIIIEPEYHCDTTLENW